MHFSVHAKRHTRSRNSDTSVDTSVNICSQKWLLARTYLWITMQIYAIAVKEGPRRFEQTHLLFGKLKYRGDWQVHCHSPYGSWLPAFSTDKAEYYLSTRSIMVTFLVTFCLILFNCRVGRYVLKGIRPWQWRGYEVKVIVPFTRKDVSSFDRQCSGHHRRILWTYLY